MDVEASVIICTFNRADSLARCLSSIEQDRSTTPTEVIVVANACTDHTSDVVRAARTRSRRSLRMIDEPVRGANRARNAGVRAAQGRILLFTDDDCVVHEHWIDAFVEAFEPDVMAAGGRVRPRLDGECPPWLEDYPPQVTLRDDGPEPFEMSADRLPVGANMAIRGDLLRRSAEPFDTRLGHTGRASIGWDESGLFLELVDRHRIVYVPTAVVDHMVEGRRMTYEFARRTLFQSGFGIARYERLRGDPMPTLPRRLRETAWWYRHALAKRWKHRLVGEVTAESAREELMAYRATGRRIESLLWRTPRLSEWLARRLP